MVIMYAYYLCLLIVWMTLSNGWSLLFVCLMLTVFVCMLGDNIVAATAAVVAADIVVVVAIERLLMLLIL